MTNHSQWKLTEEVTGECSDCEACGLKRHGLTRSDCNIITCINYVSNV